MASISNNESVVSKTKWINSLKHIFLLIALLVLWTNQAFGQCTITLSNNNSYTLPANSNNARICLTVNGERSTAINIGANTGVTIFISSNTTLTGGISQSGSAAFRIEVSGRIRGSRTLNNGSTILIQNGGRYDDNGTLTITNGALEVQTGGTVSRPINLSNSSTLTNSGTISSSLTLNNASSLANSGTINGNITLNNTGRFINSGILSGELTLNGSSTVNNSNQLNLDRLTFNGGTTLTNTSTGTLIVDQEQQLDINGVLINQGTFRFLDDEANVAVNSGGQITNTGIIQLARDFTNNGTVNSTNGTFTVERSLTNNSNGTLALGSASIGRDLINNSQATFAGNISIGRDVTNNGSGTLNLGPSTVIGRDFTNNGLTTLSGSLAVEDDFLINGSGVIRPLNTNQCNTIAVADDFTNNNSNGITGNNLTGPFLAPLLVNKAPSNRGVTGGALVNASLDCSCGAKFTNSGSFTVPAGVTQITVKAWGAGGRGGSRDRNSGTSGGGGAGAYSESTISVTPGETLFYSSGIGSTTTNPGGDSWISRNANGSNPILLAKGGNSAGVNSRTGASGGLASQGIGTIRSNGGNGSSGNDDGGRGGNAPNGGTGGQGGTSSNSDGTNGTNPGGGGGGAKTNGNGNTRNGGNGGNGQVSFSYDCDGPSTPPENGCWRYIDDGSATGVVIIEFFEDCTWNAPAGLLEFEVLAIGGGGGGGVRSGGGGGGGGAVHARALIDARISQGLPEGSSFEIKIGNGGRGSSARSRKGEDGGSTTFDADGDYEIRVGGGGGGGSDESNQRNGNPGLPSTFNSNTLGYTIVGSTLLGGSGGGGGHDGDGGAANLRRGGTADEHAGAGGGGLGGNPGANASNSSRGGNGANGRQFSRFDVTLNRFFGAGGGGGSRDNFTANGGSANAGGNGGRGDGDNATNGLNGTTPGSGGGGSGHDAETVGGDGAKGVVMVRYEIARILPVEFASFEATYNPQTREGILSWSTAKEWENSHFEVERSINDVKSWEKVGEVNGAGYSDKKTDYTYIDKGLPATGGNVFYRLRQVNFDGSHSYSVTKAIRVESLKGSSSWIIYPNPTTGKDFKLALIETEKQVEGKVEARVATTSGQMEFFSDRDINNLSETIGTYLQTKAPGVYVLQLTWNSKVESYQIIKK